MRLLADLTLPKIVSNDVENYTTIDLVVAWWCYSASEWVFQYVFKPRLLDEDSSVPPLRVVSLNSLSLSTSQQCIPNFSLSLPSSLPLLPSPPHQGRTGTVTLGLFTAVTKSTKSLLIPRRFKIQSNPLLISSVTLSVLTVSLPRDRVPLVTTGQLFVLIYK